MQHLKLGMEQGIPPLSVSIGISRRPEDGRQFVDLFNAADHAMYEAKRKGEKLLLLFQAVWNKDG